MKTTVEYLSVIVFGLSIFICLWVLPTSDQGYGYNDKNDFCVSHEIHETEQLSAVQIIFLPGMIPYLVIDKNWGEIAPWWIPLLGSIWIIFLIIITVSLWSNLDQNKKALWGYWFLTLYMTATFIYIVINGFIGNKYSW